MALLPGLGSVLVLDGLRAQETICGDASLGRFLDSVGQCDPAPGGPVQYLGQVSAGHAKASGEGRDRLASGKGTLCHVLSVVSHTTKSRGNDLDISPIDADAPLMSWPQRQRFKELVLAYRKERGMKPEDFAPMIGVKPSHLHGLLYDSRVEPSLDVVQKASAVLGVSISELVDDPGNPPAGMEGEEFTAEDRMLAQLIIHDMAMIEEGKRRSAFDVWSGIIRTMGLIK